MSAVQFRPQPPLLNPIESRVSASFSNIMAKGRFWQCTRPVHVSQRARDGGPGGQRRASVGRKTSLLARGAPTPGRVECRHPDDDRHVLRHPGARSSPCLTWCPAVDPSVGAGGIGNLPGQPARAARGRLSGRRRSKRREPRHSSRSWRGGGHRGASGQCRQCARLGPWLPAGAILIQPPSVGTLPPAARPGAGQRGLGGGTTGEPRARPGLRGPVSQPVRRSPGAGRRERICLSA